MAILQNGPTIERIEPDGITSLRENCSLMIKKKLVEDI